MLLSRSIKFIALFSALLLTAEISFAQPVPGKEENIPFLVTFGKQAKKSHGDDDYVQTFFFLVPSDFKQPFYIRIFDPDVGGKHDENITGYNTKTRFSLYGGPSCYTESDARNADPVGRYKSGNMIYTKTFGESAKYDNGWYTMGPINPAEGEKVPELGGHVFKLIAEGVSGDDGNLYRYFMSSSGDQNKSVEGGNAFTYEYTVRLHDNASQVSHIYPYVDSRVVSVKQYNYDWDKDGDIVIYSKKKLGVKSKTSGNAEWSVSEHKIVKEEHGSCLDMQFKKDKANSVKNNNVVFYVTNQYGEYLPFYAVPIGYTPTRKIVVD